jgi:hypothetical protein
MPSSAAGFCRTIVAVAMAAELATVSMGAAPAPALLVSRLTLHTSMLGSAAGGRVGPGQAVDAARYIETALARLGYEVTRQSRTQQGSRMQQIEVTLPNPAPAHVPPRVLIIGANYSPLASDPGSGVSAVIELARLLRHVKRPDGTEIRFVFFVRGIEEPGPPAGNFIAFSGTRAASDRVRKALASFHAVSSFPEEGLAAQAYVEGVTVSGKLMITDVEFLRYPYSHAGQGAGQPDYDNMARVVDALARLVRKIAAPASM